MLLICISRLNQNYSVMKPSINMNNVRFTLLFAFMLVLSVSLSYGQNIAFANNIYYPDANMDSNTNTSFISSTETLALADLTLSNANAFSTKMYETTLLAVEFEQELQIEEWMLSTFDTKESNLITQIQTQTDAETEMPVENWMTDLSGW